MSSLAAQSRPPDELVVAVDHTDDDTIDAITQDAATNAPGFPVRILEVLAPRPAPFPASGIPDNCAFHAATGEIIIHVDDDISLPASFVAEVLALLPAACRATLWAPIVFVDDQRSQLPDDFAVDCRVAMATRNRWPVLPGGVVQLPTQMSVHWGAVFATPRAELRSIGGHNIAHCGYHNTDTRLGSRLARCGAGSFLLPVETMYAHHLGLTWHMSNRHRKDVIRKAQATLHGPRVANGGDAFWSSPWFNSAYRVTHHLA